MSNDQTTAEKMAATRRDRAIASVDRQRGYTAEFAPDPEAHRREYDEREQDLAYIEAGMGEKDCNIT